MPSIIIPAHNESKVIHNCLTPFLDILEKKNFEIIVVCNGCSDSTASTVRKISNKIICLEISEASKIQALNIGDKVAKRYPRIYLDADVVLPMETLTEINQLLSTEKFLAVSPEVKMNLDNSSWFVRAYYEIWLSLPYCKAGMIGPGIYALSKIGRERFREFPNIIADDGYVRCLFKEYERGVTQGLYSIVSAPRDLSSLIKIKTRIRLGRYELEEKFPHLIANEEKNYSNAIRKLIWRIDLWPKLSIYLLVSVFTRVKAKAQRKTGVIIWERDNSSRKQ